MVLETVLADKLHQFLQVVYLCYGDTSVHTIRIVGYFALSQICFDFTLRVIGRDAEETERTFRNLGIYCTKCVDLAECTSKYAERTKFQVAVADKAFGEVAAVGADALVAVFCKVVVPVEQGRSLA